MRRWATFHEREAERYAGLICSQQRISTEDLSAILAVDLELDHFGESPSDVYCETSDHNFLLRIDENVIALGRHHQLAEQYRSARLWTIVDERSR